jgi:demethylmenaquinone methyltransferase/2-methoxy-6-polyprenyl-1,4-benzoquinol methylase
MGDQMESFYLTNLRAPILQAAIQVLDLPPGSEGLDVGCGIGSHTLLLAETVLPDGHVTGLDLSAEQIKHARKIAADSPMSKSVSFREGDMKAIPFADNSFDWIWSMDCVGYAPVEPAPVIKVLVRVVKPGGSIAILAWSSQQLLPGYPALEAKINGTSSGIAPFEEGKNRDTHFLRALGWFREVGLENTAAETMVRSVHAPFSAEVRLELQSLIEMRWPDIQSELNPGDWAEVQRICQPASADFILNLPDYYAFFTYSLFRGQVPKN